jgi:hypothetical protein
VGVGGLPEGEEVLIVGAGFGGIAGEGITPDSGTGSAPGQTARPRPHPGAATNPTHG